MHLKPIPQITLFYLLVVFLLIGCQNNQELKFGTFNYNNEEACSGCPQISIQIPEATGTNKASNRLNEAIKEMVAEQLTFEEIKKTPSIDEAVASFREAYLEFQDFSPVETIPWEARIEASIVFENKRVVCVEIHTYLFTGGAHGFDAIRYLNFDKRSGKAMEVREMFRDYSGFEQLAERSFRDKHRIPGETKINSTGFMFENNYFSLPENVGITEQGLRLYYNPYEVASYADGPIDLTIPFDEASPFISKKIKP